MKLFSQAWMPVFPLQITVSDFDLTPSFTTADLIIFGVVVAVLILIIVVYRIYKSKSPVAAAKSSGGGASGSFSIFSSFKLQSIARSIGLNHDQRKMLDFAFRIDGAADPVKSVNTPALLDRHFRRAYRVILQSSKSEEETQNKLAVLFSARNMLENNVGVDLSSTRQIKDESTIIISSGKDKYNVTVISTKGDHLTVENPKTALGTQIKLERGIKLHALLFLKNNKGFSFETRVSGYSSAHGHPSLLLAHSNQIKFLSQRRYRRRHTDIDCNLNLVYVEGTGKKQRLIVDKRKFTGEIADISVGGCSLRTKVQTQVGAKIKVEYAQGSGNVAALGQVLRSNRTGINTILHIKFLRVSRKSMNMINAFVYEYINE